jgi:biopolymer transport protein ExbD
MSWAARQREGGKRYANLTLPQLRNLVADGELGPDDLARPEGERSWRPIAAIPELVDALPRFTIRSGRRVDSGEETMDMTPMIDVVFQLLLFFMIISTFQVQKSIDVPQTEKQQQAEQVPTLGQLGRDMVIVAVGPDNSIEFVSFDASGREIGREAVGEEQLVEKFIEVALEERKSSVLIDAHDAALIDTVVAVIDAADQARLSEVRLVKRVRERQQLGDQVVEPATR